jgi:hypothetical protein
VHGERGLADPCGPPDRGDHHDARRIPAGRKQPGQRLKFACPAGKMARGHGKLAWHGRPRCGRPLRRGRRCLLAQHPKVGFGQFTPREHPQFVVQAPPQVLVDAERRCLLAGSGERDH